MLDSRLSFGEPSFAEALIKRSEDPISRNIAGRADGEIARTGETAIIAHRTDRVIDLRIVESFQACASIILFIQPPCLITGQASLATSLASCAGIVALGADLIVEPIIEVAHHTRARGIVELSVHLGGIAAFRA